MTESWQGIRHRVFVPQALGADEFLRATWHERDRIIVFSHWSGNSCVAATPVRITDVPELSELLVRAVGHAATHPVPVVEPVIPARSRTGPKVTRILRGSARTHTPPPSVDAVPRWDETG
jgi:hypothetical protein